MGLFSSLFRKKKSRDLFHGLYLHHGGLTHYIFEILTDDVEMVHQDAHHYSQGFEKILDDVDEMLYESEKVVGQKVDRIIFFIPTLGIEQHNKEVKQPFRRTISEIIRNLELEAMGYIEVFDVLKQTVGKEGHAIYLEVDEKEAFVAHLADGEIKNQKSVKGTHAHIATVVQDLVEEDTTKIYIYTSGDTEGLFDLQQDLDDYSTRLLSSSQFLHGARYLLRQQLLPDATPTVDPQDQVEEESLSDQDAVPVPSTQKAEGEIVTDSHTPRHPTPNHKTDVSSDDEVIELDESPKKAKSPSPSHLHGTTVKGFRIHKKSTGTKPHQDQVQSDIQTLSPPDEVSEPGVSDTLDAAEAVISQPDVQDEESTEPESDREEADTQSIPRRRVVPLKALGLTFLLLLIGAFAVYEYFFHKVLITVSLPLEDFKVVETLTAAKLRKSIEAKEVSVEVGTTGKRDVGASAQGRVILASFEDKQASFSAGTKLVYQDFTFQIDEDVSLDAATVDVSSGTKAAAKKSVAASAYFIGPDGNIDKGVQMLVDGYPKSLYYAVSEGPFSGGVKRTISAVSNADIKAAKAAIEEKAKQATTDLTGQVNGDEVTIEDLSNIEISSIEYSSGLGEAASSLTADAKVSAELYLISRSTLLENLKATLQKQKGSGYVLQDSAVVYTFADAEIKDEDLPTANLTVSYQAKTYQKLDPEEVRSYISLKSAQDVLADIKSRTRAKDVAVVDKSSLKLTDLYLPLISRNIDIAISPVQ